MIAAPCRGCAPAPVRPATAVHKSILLLGPRQTGKSTLVAQLIPDLTINLFHEPTYLEFARNPHELEERLAALPAKPGRQSIFIDEVQRLPSLLPYCGRHIWSSSARQSAYTCRPPACSTTTWPSS